MRRSGIRTDQQAIQTGQPGLSLRADAVTGGHDVSFKIGTVHRQELLQQLGIHRVFSLGVTVDDERRREWTGSELDHGNEEVALPPHGDRLPRLHGGSDRGVQRFIEGPAAPNQQRAQRGDPPGHSPTPEGHGGNQHTQHDQGRAEALVAGVEEQDDAQWGEGRHPHCVAAGEP